LPKSSSVSRAFELIRCWTTFLRRGHPTLLVIRVLIQLLEVQFDHSETYFALFRFESPETTLDLPLIGAAKQRPAARSRIRALGGLAAVLAPDDDAAPRGLATGPPNWNHPHFWAVFAIRRTAN
jgi:hypothetical protein